MKNYLKLGGNLHPPKKEPVFDSVIIRYGGEMGIKGAWTRRTYEKRLLSNIRRVLKHYGIPYERIVWKRGRLFLKTSSPMEASTRLLKVFGISSVSPAIETTSKIEDITDLCIFLAHSKLKKGNSFAVRCRRVGKHPYTSIDVCRYVGQKILEAFPDLELKVNLENPDVTFMVEIRDELAFVFTEIMRGSGGFPLGVQPKLVCLLSGGIDSPVACWLVMKRGCPIIPIYFDNSPFTSSEATERVLDVAKVLFDWAIGLPREIYVIKHGKNLAEIIRKCPREFTCILCKRMMYRIAERIADMEKAEGIVTGESIGEQASQTLRNLRVLNQAATKYPVHRPLLGFDKVEIENIARKIGTYEVSARDVGKCTAAPPKPSTKARINEVVKAEENLNINDIIENSLKELEKIHL